MNYKLESNQVRTDLTDKTHITNSDDLKKYVPFESKVSENSVFGAYGAEHWITKWTGEANEQGNPLNLVIFDDGFWMPLVEYNLLVETFKKAETMYKSLDDFDIKVGYIEVKDIGISIGDKFPGYKVWHELRLKKNKFKVGDEVWFLHNEKAVQSKIMCCKEMQENLKGPYYELELTRKRKVMGYKFTYPEIRPESKLFKTKEELIQSL